MPIKAGNEGVGVQSVALSSIQSFWLLYLFACWFLYFFFNPPAPHCSRLYAKAHVVPRF